MTSEIQATWDTAVARPRQPGVSVIDTVLTGNAYEMETAVPLFIGYTEKGQRSTIYRISSYSDYEEQLGGPDPLGKSVLAYAVRHYFDNKGKRCLVLSVNNYEVFANVNPLDVLSRLTDSMMLEKVANQEEATLLAVPDCVAQRYVRPDGWTFFWKNLLRARKGRSDLFFLFDLPRSVDDANAVRKDLSDPDAAFGAAYWPHLITDYLGPDGERIVLPPSAAVAAAIGVTDRERGIWKAPANVPLSHVIQPQYGHIPGEALFDEADTSVNLIRSFPGRGVRIWGARTLEKQAGSPWRYVQTRRLVSYIQQQLGEQCRFAVFEPNNELTWVKVKGLARAWLRKLWQRGALSGATEDEAFRLFLGLDESMTKDDIDQGLMIFRIGLALQYPAELVELRLQFNTRESDVVQLGATYQNRSWIA